MDEPRDDFLAGARFAGNEHGGIGRGDLRRVAQHPAPFDRLADDAQVGARRRMVEHSRHGGVDTLGTIVVDVVVRLCDSQHRHCPPCLLGRLSAFARGGHNLRSGAFVGP